MPHGKIGMRINAKTLVNQISSVVYGSASHYLPYWMADIWKVLILSGQSLVLTKAYKILVEKGIIYTTVSLYSAEAYLFGLFRGFNMEHPKGLLGTFEIMQR